MGKKSFKRPNGEGMVRKRKDGRWEARITTSKDHISGKPITRSFYGKTRQEAVSKMNEAIVRRQHGVFTNGKPPTVENWMLMWLESVKYHLKPNTYRSYEGIVQNHIIPAFPKLQLDKLTTRNLQTLYTEKFENGRVDGLGGLSARSVQLIHTVMHLALEQAIEEGIIHRNVSKGTKKPKGPAKEIKFMTPDEQTRLQMTVKGERLEAAFVLGLATGLRRGELLGLKWDDFDLEGQTVKISRSLGSVPSPDDPTKSVLAFQSLKTKKSKRTIDLPESTIKTIRRHKASQNEEKLKYGSSYTDNGLVFCTDKGKFLSPRNFNRKFTEMVDKCGLSGLTPHSMRHSYASTLLGEGINIKIVQELLGHEKVSTTLNIYAHLIREDMREAVKKIDYIFAT